MTDTQLDIEGETFEGERKPRMLDMRTGNRVHSIKDRNNDLYETPPVAVKALLKVESIPLCVWDCCCGPGVITKALRDTGRAVIATDLVDYGCPDSIARRDFLLEREAPDGVPSIVMNPPFKLAEEFVAHAINLVPDVYVLLRVAFLEGLRWEARGLRHHLARVHVFAPRLPMMHRAGWEGPVNSNSGMAFGWYSFHRDWGRKGGRPTIDWINWKQL